MAEINASDGFDPYYVWLGIAVEDQPPHHYRLLDVRLYEADANVIDTGYQRRMAYVKGIKAGEHLDQAERLREELSEALHCLLNPAKKQAYDAALRERRAKSATGQAATVARPSPPKGPASAIETVVGQLTEMGFVEALHLTPLVPPYAHPASVAVLAQALVRNRRLTPFQAERVAAGRIGSLILGNYRLLEEIGHSGTGRMYKAEHRRMRRQVALKTLPPERMKDPNAVARFEREVSAAAKLTHPNIVAAHDAGESDGVHFFVMEYVDGIDLSTLVKRQGPLAISWVLDFLHQAASGLDYAHRSGVVHRDVKPGNLLLDKQQRIKLLDLGLARFDDPGGAKGVGALTGAGAVLGTIDYMSPEQATGAKNADARSDIYSLGCTLHFLLTGREIYSGATRVAIFMAHRDAPIPELQALRPDCPPELASLFRRMVAKAPKDRPESMKVVLDELDRCRRRLSSAPPPLPTPVAANVAAPAANTMPFAAQVASPMPLSPTAAPPRPMVVAKSSPTGSTVRRGVDLRLVIAGGSAVVLFAAGVLYILRMNSESRVVEITQPPAVVEIPRINPVKAATPATSAKVAAGPATGTVTTPSVKLSGNLGLFLRPTGSTTSAFTVDSLHYDGTHPLTIEMWCRPNYDVMVRRMAQGRFGLSERSETTDLVGFFSVGASGQGRAGRISIAHRGSYLANRAEPIFYWCFYTSSYSHRIMPALWANTLQHVAMVITNRDDGYREVTYWVNGRGSSVVPATLTIPIDAVLPFRAGASLDVVIDEMRVSKSARYIDTFVPERRFEPDAETLALYHCDEGSGNQMLDASSHARHAVLASSATWVQLDDKSNAVKLDMTPPTIPSTSAPTPESTPPAIPAPSATPTPSGTAR